MIGERGINMSAPRIMGPFGGSVIAGSGISATTPVNGGGPTVNYIGITPPPGCQPNWNGPVTIYNYEKIEPYLNKAAFDLCDYVELTTLSQKDKTIGMISKRVVEQAVYASKVVPVVNGKVDQVYIEKWASFLNHLALTGLWTSSLLPFSVIALDDPYPHMSLASVLISDGRYATKAMMCTYFHLNSDWPNIMGINPNSVLNAVGAINSELNKFIGWDVFVNEQETGNDDWTNCPFNPVSANTVNGGIVDSIPPANVSAPIDLSKYPHKCPRCSYPSYNGFNSIDCTNPVCK